jgi:WASH complex subunit CCDC53
MEHRNTLVFLNQFIMQTTKFLNRFASVCEDRLLDLSKRIQKLDVSLSILESKLQSIKSLNEIQASKQYEAPGILLAAGNEPPPTQTSQSQPNEPPAAANSSVPPPPPTTSDVAATSEDVSDQNANGIIL